MKPNVVNVIHSIIPNQHHTDTHPTGVVAKTCQSDAMNGHRDRQLEKNPTNLRLAKTLPQRNAAAARPTVMVTQFVRQYPGPLNSLEANLAEQLLVRRE
jgi:hypothetical protein